MAVGNKTQRDFDLDLAVEAYLQNQNSNNLGRIIKSATGLIYYFIKLYGGGRNEQDLFQVGVEGLLKAVQRYDSSYNASLK